MPSVKSPGTVTNVIDGLDELNYIILKVVEAINRLLGKQGRSGLNSKGKSILTGWTCLFLSIVLGTFWNKCKA